MKNKRIIISILVAVLLIGLLGFTYAFFTYSREGTENNQLQVGRIVFHSSETKTINLENAFPISRDTLTTDPENRNIGTFELEVSGDTDYNKGIEYVISIVNSHITSSTGQIVPISLDYEIEGLGSSNTNYFIDRKNLNTTIYKRLTGNGIMGDGKILVGYIKPNTTKGTIEGINGKITIKAFLDTNKIIIVDNNGGTNSNLIESTNEGETVTLTKEEWDSLELSFQVKVEAQEGIWVEETLYDILDRNAVMDNINSTYVNNATPGIDFSGISSDTNGKGVYTFSSTANDAYPVKYYRGAVTNNNVLFANKCWKMVRTTDTGGVKLIYNGENKGTEEAPNCDNTGADTQITLNIDGQDVNTFKFNEYDNSPVYNGYMYGTVYSVTKGEVASGAYFGNSFTYDSTNNLYTLTNAKEGIDETHHYTCNETTDTGTCASIRYYFTYYTRYYLYFTLSDGKSIEDAISEMQANTTNSNAKDKIDTWYAANIGNIARYAQMLENTIFCNDRRISTLGGLNPNGGILTSAASAYYAGYARADATYSPSLSCRKIDAFTLSNGRGNGDLSNPVGLITSDEIMLAGGKTRTANGDFYLKSGANYWSSSPAYFYAGGYAYGMGVNSAGNLYLGNAMIGTLGLRPVLSLKNGTIIESNGADGTVNNPYIIK